jgi:uncharacterized protein YhfF
MMTVEEFWKKYLLTIPQNERDKPYFEAESWGNSPELADRIAHLILSGVKTATSSLLWSQQILQWTLEKPGDQCIVLDSLQNPVCIIEVQDVFVKPFDEVDPAFVYAYGEGDRSMEFWNTNMWEYYEEECEELGRTAEKDMPMICKVFKVIYDGAN